MIVLAGDIAPYNDGLAAELARSWEGARHIAYVPGNVEFFGTEIDEARARLAGDCREAGIDFLDRAMVRIGSVPFIGATLWTDLKLAGRAARECTQALLAKHAEDFQGRIRHRGEDLTPAESVRRHVADLRFIERELEQAERAVVVTHHAPSALSVPAWRRGDAIGSLHASARTRRGGWSVLPARTSGPLASTSDRRGSAWGRVEPSPMPVARGQ